MSYDIIRLAEVMPVTPSPPQQPPEMLRCQIAHVADPHHRVRHGIEPGADGIALFGLIRHYLPPGLGLGRLER